MQSANDTTSKNKTSAKKNIITIVIAVLAIAALVGAWFLYTHPNVFVSSENKDAASVSSSLDSVLLSRKITSIPYMPTDIENVVYTADAAGNITYYEFNGTDYVELAPTGTMDLTVPLSGQQIPVKIPYVERDGVLSGYGVFSTENTDSNVYIYSFVMFKVQNLPAAYAQTGSCLLLIHTDKTQAYTLDPVWEQAFILNRSNGSVTDFLNDRAQKVSADGGIRRDYYMITEGGLKETTSAVPFFSSRERTPDANGVTQVDLYMKTGRNGRDDTMIAENVGDRYVKLLGNGAFAYIRKTDSGFSTVKYENGKESIITTFYAGYGTSYIRNGDYILSKEDGRIFTTYDTSTIETKGYKMNPLLFAVSPDGKYVVMAGTVANALDYRIYVYNTETQKYAVFNETNYAAHNNLRFINDTTVAYYVVNVDGYENVVLDLSKVK